MLAYASLAPKPNTIVKLNLAFKWGLCLFVCLNQPAVEKLSALWKAAVRMKQKLNTWHKIKLQPLKYVYACQLENQSSSS